MMGNDPTSCDNTIVIAAQMYPKRFLQGFRIFYYFSINSVLSNMHGFYGIPKLDNTSMFIIVLDDQGL